MAKYGYAPISIAMVWQFHDDMQVRVQDDGEYSEPFPVTNGIKQGCVMVLWHQHCSALCFLQCSHTLFRTVIQPKEVASQFQCVDRCSR